MGSHYGGWNSWDMGSHYGGMHSWDMGSHYGGMHSWDMGFHNDYWSSWDMGSYHYDYHHDKAPYFEHMSSCEDSAGHTGSGNRLESSLALLVICVISAILPAFS